MKSSKQNLRIGEMLRYLESNVDDFGLQKRDTTCDWCGWFGYGIETPNKWRFEGESLHGLLVKMVESVKPPNDPSSATRPGGGAS